MDPVALARINLFAVLRTLEDLPDHDAASQIVVRSAKEVIQFAGPAVGVARLTIGPDGIVHTAGKGPHSISLFFPRASDVNAMFAGTGNPIPLKGFNRIGFLKGDFTALTDRLTHYLRPSPADLGEPSFARVNAILTLHLATYALAEIGNYDPRGRLNAARIPDGNVVLSVEGGPVLCLTAAHGRLSVTKGMPAERRARMHFSGIDVAGQVLRGELSSYTAVGRDDIQLSGHVAALDNVNKILGLVPHYLG